MKYPISETSFDALCTIYTKVTVSVIEEAEEFIEKRFNIWVYYDSVWMVMTKYMWLF